MTISDLSPGEKTVDVSLPAWRTGRYAILDFAGGVVEFGVSNDAGEPLLWDKVDKNTWRITKGKSRTVRVEYGVYANEFQLRTRGLNSEHGFVDGTAVFMYLRESRTGPVELEVVPYAGWHVTTGLDSVPGRMNVFAAPTYDILVDCPLEIGTQRDYQFAVEGKAHVLSIYGTFNCDIDSLLGDISAIVKMNAEFWGTLPYRRYVFFFHAMPGAGGGTEHCNSSVMGVSPDPSFHPSVRKDLRGLISHEFFHTWNVKQFRPRGMESYDWDRENYSRELWIAEGATSYMHGRLLARAGLSGPLTLEDVSASIQSERSRPGNQLQSLNECSFDAWIKAFKNNEQAFNFETDIYGKGAQVCALMDLEIRQRSQNRQSFDDLLRALYKRFPLGTGGYTVEDVLKIADEIAGSSMKGFFQDFVSGRKPLDWRRAIGYAGLRLDTVEATRPWWGVLTSEEAGRTIIRQVVRGSSAYAGGIQVGDEVVALGGFRVSSASLQTRIAECVLGDTVKLTLFREGRQREVVIPLTIPHLSAIRISRIPDPSELQKRIYSSWLGRSN
jgi:predicted metalloprotease with PDZ domain